MFRWLSRRVLLQSIKHALRKNAPSQFSYADKNDYFVTILTNKLSQEEVLVSAIGPKVIEGMAWSEDRFQSPTTIPVTDVEAWSPKFIRFYGFNKINYPSLADFLVSELTFRPWRAYLKESFAQSLYNYRTKFRKDRIEVLKRLVQVSLKEAEKNNGLLTTNSWKSVVGLLSEVYGNRVYGHPGYEAEAAHFRLILESLVATGELEKQKMHEFKLNGLALASISNYELEERRHRDSVRQNRLLFFVTVVMAVAAVVQAYSTFWRPE
jgi:hypothetical protein